MKYLLFLAVPLVFLSLLASVTSQKSGSLSCYECNVFSAGYGTSCVDPAIRDDCHVCMKIETHILHNHYKNSADDSCYECNVYAAGYGTSCKEPMIKTGCHACMKTDTTVYVNHHRKKYDESNVISKVCGGKEVEGRNYCVRYFMNGGISRRCYCTGHLCNGGRSLMAGLVIILPALLITLWKLA